MKDALPDIRQTIVTHLVKRYRPRAIILHGSRAKRLSRPRSDWDVYILCDKPVRARSEVLEGQHLDVDVIRLPTTSRALFLEVGSSWKDGEILFDDDSKIGANLMRALQRIYRQGKHLKTDQMEQKRAYMERTLGRLEDTLDQPELFFLRLGHFYDAAYNYWFDIRNEWTRPLYEAFPEITARDPLFAKHLRTLSGAVNNKIKLRAAKWIYSALFPHTQRPGT